MKIDVKITKRLYDKKFRQQLRENPSHYASELGYQISSDAKIIVKQNTKEIFYVTMVDTRIESGNLDMNIQSIQVAGQSLSSAGTASSASSASSATSTLGTLTTGACVGSIGSAGDPTDKS